MPLAGASSPVSHWNLRGIEVRVSPRWTRYWRGDVAGAAATDDAGAPIATGAAATTPPLRTIAAVGSLATRVRASSARGPSTQWRWYNPAIRRVAFSVVPVG